MSEKSATPFTVLNLRFKLQVSPGVVLAHSQEAAINIAAIEGLIWKIWLIEEDEFEMGGMYLFANRAAAEAYLNHPIVQAVRSSSAVVSTESHLWNAESSLSAITRGPLPDIATQHSKPACLLAGGE
jgi:hypothetical protein